MGKSSVIQSLLLPLILWMVCFLTLKPRLNGSLVNLARPRTCSTMPKATNFEIGVVWADGAHASCVLHCLGDADVLRMNPRSMDRDVFTRPSVH